ncbi:hypothetical protein E6Q11_06580 [Candidatus Dojkabacteria bacterium]|uniref:Uncharacterized protein n=1 Tax=Candidatus Dojkabacteria bacterium TaxID=2099670 RepID=A0A5C7J2T6_9BACT|nr:MAG: hypothetical protein E6Q11_06580 [Candidatus Dojkabacteria bacterium]
MVQTHADQLNKMRENMNEFKETMLATSHSISHVKNAIEGFNVYLQKVERDNDLRLKEIERKIEELEDKGRFVGVIRNVISNVYFWVFLIFFAFCVDKSDIMQWLKLIKG